jgi:hypothetical protein
LTLDDFKALSKEELQGIIAKLKKPLDVGRETKSGKMDSSTQDTLMALPMEFMVNSI